MRITKSLILFISIILAAACRNSGDATNENATVDEMKDFVFAEDGFKAGFPCKPVKSERMIDSKYGKLSEQVISCKTASGIYSVSYWDYPSAPPSSVDVYDEETEKILREYKNELTNVTYNDGVRNGMAGRYFAGDDGKPIGNPPKFRHIREFQHLKGARHYIVRTVVETDEQTLHNPLLWATYDFLQRFIVN